MESREQALAHLRTRTLFVTSLMESSSAGGVLGSLIAFFPISRSVHTTFVRSFATLIGAGVPMLRALHVIADGARDARLREALDSVASDIESGSALSVALSRRPREFSNLFVAMIRAGEAGGALDEILERLASFVERDHAIQKRIRSAMMYPIVVAASTIALVLFLITNTMPAFAALFAQMHVPLPWSTRALLAVGSALKTPQFWIAAIAVALASAVFVCLARHSESVARRIDRILLVDPLFGAIRRKSIMARFSRTLGTLLGSGVPLLNALDASRDVLDNAIVSGCVRDLVVSLGEGSPIVDSLERSRFFDGLALQLIRTGEETGMLDAMLLRVATSYELDVETTLAALGSVIEPVIIILLGAVVGTVVASILIPLYSMIGGIK
jgi:type IV pilus assembly protein PilC